MSRSRGVFLAIMILMVTFVLIGCNRPAPDETVQKFIDGLKNEKYEDIYQLLTVDAKNRISESDFTRRYREIYKEIGKVRIQLEMVRSEGEQWEITDNRTEVVLQGDMFTWTVEEISLNQKLLLLYEENTWHIDWRPTNILPQLTDANQRIVVTRTPATRGEIYDRLGTELAGKGAVFSIGVVPGKLEDEEVAINRLAELLDLMPEQIQKALEQKWVKPELFVPLRSITEHEWLAKKKDFLAISGMLASKREGRVYSGPVSLAPTLGYLGEVNSEELKKWESAGYQLGDKVGRSGLEQKYEKYLAGKPGYMIRIVDQQGREVAMIKFTRPMAGIDLYLSIDRQLQEIIAKHMGDKQGAVVAMTPKTGEVLALASFPGFDANEFLLGGSTKSLGKLLNDPTTPLLNRPIQGQYIPGSTFKPLTVIAALDHFPEYDPFEMVELPENTWRAEPSWGSYRVKRVDRPQGPVDLEHAMKWSDNIYFAQLAYQMGSEPLFKVTDKVGFGEDIPFVLDVARSSLANQRSIPNSILLADSGYGQGQVLMTPLHLAMLYSAIATDGKIIEPVLTSSEDRGQIWKESITTTENLKLLQVALEKTVQDPTALAYKANIPELDLAGKTGTAQVGNDREMGWFVCYLPVSDPEFLLLVGIEDVTEGSSEAITVAKNILLEYYQVATPELEINSEEMQESDSL